LLVLPDAILVDTSFVVEVLSPKQPAHADAVAFAQALAAADTTLVYNRLLELELDEVLYQVALKERHPRDWRRFRHDGRARRRANRLVTGSRSAWAEFLSAFGYVAYTVEEVTDRIPELMTRYGFASYDAVHAATALEAGVSAIVALDTAFAKLPASRIAIYTDSTRVANCRRYRRASAI
jgi:predicted nucleic acid-binding protein